MRLTCKPQTYPRPHQPCGDAERHAAHPRQRPVGNAADVGDNTGELDGMIHGEGGQIAIDTQSPQSPGVFKPVGQADYVHIIMPMSIR